MQENQKNKNAIFYLAGFNLFICFFVMGSFVLHEHFSIDDYWIYDHQDSSALNDISSNLRFVSGCLYYYLDRIGVNIVKNQILFGILLICVFAWASTYISIELAGSIGIQSSYKKLLLLNGGTLVMLLNVSLGEYLYFSGVYLQWAISLISMVIAAVCIGKEENIRKNWTQGVLALSVTAGSYQIFIAQYAYLVMFIIYVRNKGCISRISVWAIIRAAGAALTAVAVNLVCVQSFMRMGIVGHDSRMKFNLSEIPRLLVEIVQAQKIIWVEGIGVFPKYSLGFGLVLMLVTLGVCLYKRKANAGEYIYIGIVLLSGQCVMWAAVVLQGNISVLLRMLSPVFGVFTVGVWMFSYYCRQDGRKLIQYPVIVAIILFLGFSSIKIQEIAVDTQITNAVTKCYMQEIDSRISNYEKEYNVKVTKVGFCTDRYISYKFYNYIRSAAYGDFCYNPFLPSWSNITSLNFYSGRNLALTEVPEHIKRYYENKNWDCANWDEQIYLNNDTVYICAF